MAFSKNRYEWGIFSKIIGATRNSRAEPDLLNGFLDPSTPFALNNVRGVIRNQANEQQIKASALKFRECLAAEDVKGAATALEAYLEVFVGAEDDPQPIKMMRALVHRMEHPLENKNLVFLFLDRFTCDSPLGRILCRMVVKEEMLDDFEKYVAENHSAEDIASRAKFYSKLEKNFIKNIAQ